MKKAILIIACDRLHYFEATWKSLMANEHQDWDIWVSVDALGNKYQQEYLKLIKESKREVGINFAAFRMGTGLHVIGAKEFLFENQGYEAVLTIEDDIITAPNFLHDTHALFMWANRNFNNIGWVTCYNNLLNYPAPKWELTSHVLGSDAGGSVGVMQGRKSWDIIAPVLKEYREKFLKGKDYGKLDNLAIQEWIKRKISIYQYAMKPGNFPRPFNWDSWFKRQNYGVTTQDGIHVLACYINGLQNVATMVNRCKNIGVEGLHCNPQIWSQLGLDKITLEQYSPVKTFTILP